jgi:hypothetical protein
LRIERRSAVEPVASWNGAAKGKVLATLRAERSKMKPLVALVLKFRSSLPN